MSSVFDNIPDVDFTEGITLESVKESLTNDYTAAYKGITGKEIALSGAEPETLILNACALMIYQAYRYVDRTGKMDLTKYATGDYLDNIGALKHTERQKSTAATTVIRFALAEIRDSVVSIPPGTRITGALNLYFATISYGEVKAGELYTDIAVKCETEGLCGNDIEIGELNALVDISNCPYIATVSNINKTAGGREIETDDSYRESIYNAPAAYSVAGPENAYKAQIKKYNSDISDICILSPSAGVVDVRFLMSDGSLPSHEEISGVTATLKDRNIRPMTDNVQVSAPDIVEYSINLTYYIDKSDANSAVNIQKKVNEAVEEYKKWQRTTNRDINPDRLNMLIVSAGAKRTSITLPVYTVVSSGKVSDLRGCTIKYGGLEDD